MCLGLTLQKLDVSGMKGQIQLVTVNITQRMQFPGLCPAKGGGMITKTATT